METIAIDIVTAVVAALLFMILGAFWYSPLLFGKVWSRLSGMNAAVQKKKWLRFLGAFVNALVMAFFLSIIEAFMGAASTKDGIYIGVGIWLGFIATTHLPAVIWGKKPFRLYLIDVGFFFFGYALMGGVIGA